MPNWKKIIVSGSDASLSSAYIEGNLTASAAYLTSASIGHLETIYETASVIYSSGSTKFGDTSDDTHERTGSVDISGSLTVDGDTSLSNLTVTDTATYNTVEFTNSNIMKFNQRYTGGSNGSYFTNGEYQKVVTITPSGDAQNYQVVGRITAQNAGETHTVFFNAALRSNTLPDLDYTINYEEEYNGSRYIDPQLWVKETTTAGFIIAFKALGTIYGSVTIDFDVIPRTEAQKANVTINQVVDSEQTSVDAGFTAYDMQRNLRNQNGNFTISGSVTADSINGSDASLTNTTADSAVLTLTTTEDSSNAGPVVTLKRNSSSPADADYLGQLKFKGENDADQEVVYTKITSKIGDASDGSEDGIIEFANRRGGLNVITARLKSDKLQLLNGTDLDVDGDVTADNFIGTASIADLATTASHALNVPDTASHALTAVTASHTAGTASLANTATTSSYTLTGDGTFSGSFSGSFQGDASQLNVNPFPFTGSGEMQGKLTIESFNDYIDDYVEQYFAGTAIASSGDIALTGSIFSPYINADSFTGSLSGSLIGTASYAITASHVIGGGGGDTAISSSLAETASFYEGSVISASFSETASFYGGSVISASLSETSSFVETAQTASYMTTGSFKQPVQFVKTEPATASLYHLHIMSASSAITMSLPEGTSGDWFKVSNMLTGSLLESFGSQNIMSASGDLTLDTANAGLELIYTDDINGWVIIGN